jgi:ribose 5-phosphate isomerase B
MAGGRVGAWIVPRFPASPTYGSVIVLFVTVSRCRPDRRPAGRDGRFEILGLPMSDTTVALASDHAGYDLKMALMEEVTALGLAPLDLGTHARDSVDYPDYGTTLAEAVASGKAARGIVVCGTGIGISIAANRNPAVRAALCHDTTTARLARQHNDANVLAVGARTTGAETAKDILRSFLETPFEGGRHARRVDKLGVA